jgi:putative aldouronate transport system permease protein
MQRTSLTKKQIRGYREFLYVLPFLILVLIFSYYPLYGWVYAFFDYKPPKPLSESTFVGLKWFKSMVENEVKRKQLVSVLRNTFAMSGISLFFSWFPMIFAIFLNEIKCKPYKKFVQTVTTLPNFVSWVLVYAVAYNVFSNSGALNSLLKEWGMITKPID